MNPKISSVHILVHVVLLIIIIGLSGFYFQLWSSYEELTFSCAMEHRAAREMIVQTDQCLDGNTVNNHNCFYKGSLASSDKLFHQRTTSFSSDVVVTEITSEAVHKSISISNSKFVASGMPFQTSEALTIDEFGKTEKEDDSLEFQTFSTQSTKSGLEGTSLMDITIIEIPTNKNNDIKKSTPSEIKDFPSQGSTSIEREFNKHHIPSNIYGSKMYTNEHERTSSSAGSSETGTLSLETLFDIKLLDAPETDDSLQVLTKRHQLTEKSNLGQIHTETGGGDSDLSMENGSSRYEENGSEVSSLSQVCTMTDDTLDIQPMRMMETPYKYTQSYKENLHAVAYDEVDDGGDDDNDEEFEDEKENYVLLSRLFKKASVNDLKRLATQGSSVRCTAQDGSKSCHFQNLCYKIAHRDFIFVKSKNSVVHDNSLQKNADQGEVFSINLSAVPDHNANMLSLVTIPADSFHKFPSVSVIHRRSVLMSRFKPDNIMHVFHDDVLPLFYTIQKLNLISGSQMTDVAILFTDHFNDGEFISLYSALSSVQPGPLWKLNNTADILCFSNAYMGISSSTLWYQYGFFKSQGPLNVKGSEVLPHIRSAVYSLVHHFNTPCVFCNSRDYLVLLSRKDSRMILNEGELILSIARTTKLKVMSVSMETHSIREIITIVQNSRGIISMHGSLLIFVIFLQPGSFVVELFPYAVNPTKYTPFKTFCDFPDSGIVYKSWVNLDRDKSVSHPDWSPEMGGIQHLPSNIQETIINQSEVPDHICCEDPSWLYHIYQDTVVNVTLVTSLIVQALSETYNLQLNAPTRYSTDFPVMPGKVSDLTCKLLYDHNKKKQLFVVAWKLPWNLEFLSFDFLESQMVIQEQNDEKTDNVQLPSGILSYSFEPSEQEMVLIYNVWVRVTINHSQNSPYAYVLCRDERPYGH